MFIVVRYGKLILAVAIISMFLTSCLGYRQIQAEIKPVYLERIEKSKYRSYPGDVVWLIWRDTRKPANEWAVMIPVEDTVQYKVGMRMYSLMRR